MALLGRAEERGWDYAASFPAGTGAFLESIFNTAHAGWGFAVRAALILGVVFALLAHRRLARQRVPLAIAAAIATALCAVALPHPPPFERAWLFLVPLWLISAAAGICAPAGWIAARLRHVGAGGQTGKAQLAALVTPTVATAITVTAFALTFSPSALPHGEDPPVTGADEAARALARTVPQAVVAISPLTLPEMCFAAQQQSDSVDFRTWSANRPTACSSS